MALMGILKWPKWGRRKSRWWKTTIKKGLMRYRKVLLIAKGLRKVNLRPFVVTLE